MGLVESMKRTVTMFSSQVGNQELALISQVLENAPHKVDEREHCSVWQWHTQALVAHTELQQIVPDADFIILESTPQIRLACFDMDSTLIKAEVIDELAAEFGIKDKVAAITNRAMRGEIDFRESFVSRLALLEGLSESALESVYARLPIMPGARKLITGLNKLGIETVIISGGFSFFAERLAADLGMSQVFSNTLDCVNGKLTGKVIEPVVDAEFKAAKLLELSHAMGVETTQVLAVGDGANDIPMLNSAGIGIAFHAKPKVQEMAPFSLSRPDLSSILDLL